MPSHNKDNRRARRIKFERKLFNESIFRADLRVIAYASKPKFKDISVLNLVLDLECIVYSKYGYEYLIELTFQYPQYAEMLFGMLFSLQTRSGIANFRLPLHKKMALAIKVLKDTNCLNTLLETDPTTFSKCFFFLAELIDFANKHQKRGAVLLYPDYYVCYGTNKNYSQPIDLGTEKVQLAEFRYALPKDQVDLLNNLINYYAHNVYQTIKHNILNIKDIALIRDDIKILFNSFGNKSNQDIASEILNGKGNLISELIQHNKANMLYTLLSYLDIAIAVDERLQLYTKLTDLYKIALANTQYGICLALMHFIPFDTQLFELFHDKIYVLPINSEKRTFLLDFYVTTLNKKTPSPELFAHLKHILVLKDNKAIFPTPNRQLYNNLYTDLLHICSHAKEKKSSQKRHLSLLNESVSYIFECSNLLAVNELIKGKAEKRDFSIHESAKQCRGFYNFNKNYIFTSCHHHDPKKIVKQYTAQYEKLEKKARKLQNTNSQITQQESRKSRLNIFSARRNPQASHQETSMEMSKNKRF